MVSRVLLSFSFVNSKHTVQVHGHTATLISPSAISDDGLGIGFLPCSDYDHILENDIGCDNRAKDVALWRDIECAEDHGLSLALLLSFQIPLNLVAMKRMAWRRGFCRKYSLFGFMEGSWG